MIILQILFSLAIIKYMRFLIKGQMKFLKVVHFALRDTKFGGGESPSNRHFAFITGHVRAGREFPFPKTLFLPAPPERRFPAAPTARQSVNFFQNRFGWVL